ncbi:hypothetical protein BGX26_008868, partial [Mortierella sp. AD094]
MPTLIASEELGIGYDITILCIATAAISQLQDPQAHQGHSHPQRSRFPGTILAGLDPGPRVTDVNFEDINVGYIPAKDELVKFGNPKLMAMLFPELFPYGQGAFSLSHHKTNLRNRDRNEDDDDPDGDLSFSIRTYA